MTPNLKGARPHLREMAKAIQAAMAVRGMSVKALTAALGMEPRQVPAVYNWIAGKNAMLPETRTKLAKVLDLPEAVLVSPLPVGHKGKLVLAGPAQRAVALAETAGVTPGPVAEPVRDVFSIVGRSDGQISVRLQATLDAGRGMALARFLMDFGLIVGDHAENEAS